MRPPPVDLDELRAWAESHAPLGYVQARQVLVLLDRDALRYQEVSDCDEVITDLSARLNALLPYVKLGYVPHPCA